MASYRLQFSSSFKFRDALRIVPYLDALGITTLYASPLLQARSGSTHGYDVTDPTKLNRELGTRGDFDRLVTALHARGMRLLLDIVPNHMAASSENPWWVDVLEKGPYSRYARWFDIEWQPPSRTLRNRVLLPVLGCSYGRALTGAELQVAIRPTGLCLRYWETDLPLAPHSYARVLAPRTGTGSDLGRSRAAAEFENLLARVQSLPAAVALSAGWEQEIESVKRDLWSLYRHRPEIRVYLDEQLAFFNSPRSRPSALRTLLAEQAYVLCYWRNANYAINYRRFFAISELVGVRVEKQEVFEATHGLILQLLRQGKVSSFRVDHIDGLFDPRGYLDRLAAAMHSMAAGRRSSARAGTHGVVVEKILGPGEDLPREWAVDGTTGYDFLNAVNGLFIAPDGLESLRRTFGAFAGRHRADYVAVAAEARRQVMASHFAGEMQAFTLHLERLAREETAGRRAPQGVTSADWKRALTAVIVGFPVYRTYIRPGELSAADREHIGRAIAAADATPGVSRAAIRFIERVLLSAGDVRREAQRKGTRNEALRFVRRLQQFTGPVMAKGVEDTAFYRYNVLASANEVGGDPAAAAIPPAELHQRLESLLQARAGNVNTTTTHDTKRSEDARARINVLSEVPEEWARLLSRWSQMNRRLKCHNRGGIVPEPAMEALFYQTLIGSWPLAERSKIGVAFRSRARRQPPESDHVRAAFAQRIRDYMLKAAREAKAQTRWVRPNPEYESALADFVAGALDRARSPDFIAEVEAFARALAPFGAVNSLAQLAIKIAAPGVPDFYQGGELWDLRLVDPDNRGPVGFAARRRLLDRLSRPAQGPAAAGKARAAAAQRLCREWQTGAVKMFVMQAGLCARRACPEVFLQGKYLPLAVDGARAENIFAFARRYRKEWALVIVPRLLARTFGLDCARLAGLPAAGWHGEWGDTALRLPRIAPREWREVFTGTAVAVNERRSGRQMLLPCSALLARLPIALLRGAA
jgi:(1->4)-alpha-D-glucan 1-alpha-D-glucosylmutase